MPGNASWPTFLKDGEYSLDTGKDHKVLEGGSSLSFMLLMQPCIRMCKTPDRKRVAGAWMLYRDVNEMYPTNKVWQTPSTPSPPPYKICPVESKGLGMIATRNIHFGELIVRERPVIMAPSLLPQNPSNRWGTITEMLLRLLYWLEQEDREKVVQLSNCKPLDEYGPLAGLFFTNSLRAEFPTSQLCAYYGAICLEMSYANHSCNPSADHLFDENSVTLSLYAIRDIAAGEEITISYVDNFLPCSQRQMELRVKYSFVCTCTRCSAPPTICAASDNRRQFIRNNLPSLDDITERWKTCASFRERLLAKKRDFEAIEAVLRAMDEENLYEERVGAFQRLAFMYAALSDLKNFKKIARKCLKVYESRKDWNVADATWCIRWQDWSKTPKTFPSWGIWA